MKATTCSAPYQIWSGLALPLRWCQRRGFCSLPSQQRHVAHAGVMICKFLHSMIFSNRPTDPCKSNEVKIMGSSPCTLAVRHVLWRTDFATSSPIAVATCSKDVPRHGCGEANSRHSIPPQNAWHRLDPTHVCWGRYNLTEYIHFPTAHPKKHRKNTNPHQTKQNAKEMFQTLNRYETILPK